LDSDLTKAEVARRQLGTALSLFLDDSDPVSVHCLACGGGEIAEQLAQKTGQHPFLAFALAANPTVDVVAMRKSRNAYWNAFKHATGLDGKAHADKTFLADFSDLRNDETLFIGWFDYANAVGHQPIEAQLFTFWCLSKHTTEFLAWLPAYGKWFADIGGMTRSAQKRGLRDAIELARQMPETLTDAKTDRRPLILPA
jgi:hypothetical protein